MANLASRFGEYAITGGFFIFSQLFVFVFVFHYAFPNVGFEWLTGLGASLATWVAAFPLAQQAFTSLLVALSLVSVVFFGLLLDLVGPILVFQEIPISRDYFVKNKLWLSELVDAEFPDYAHDDLAGFLADFPPKGGALLFWRRARFRRYRALLLPLHRLKYLLIAYVYEAQSGSKVDWLREQMRLSYMSRAVSATLYLVSLELIVILALVISFQYWGNTPRMGEQSSELYVWFVPGANIVGQLALISSIYITRRAYSRFCLTLFSLAYAQTRWERGQQEETIGKKGQSMATGSDPATE